MSNIIKWRVEQLRAMDTLIRSVNDEDLVFDTWLMVGIPDGSDESDLIDIASDTDAYKDICETFLECMRTVLKAVDKNGLREFGLAQF